MNKHIRMLALTQIVHGEELGNKIETKPKCLNTCHLGFHYHLLLQNTYI